MGNIGTLAIGVLLVICVLFIGYRMDTSSEKSPSKKNPYSPKKPNKSKVKEEYIEEVIEDIDEFDIPYESEDDVFFENDSHNDYEDDDISLFGISEDVESTFNNDIDDEIFFNIKKEDEKVVDVPTKKKEVKKETKKEAKKETKKKEKVKDNEDDFSSTMVFDSAELNDNEEMDQVDQMVAILDEFGKSESLVTEEEADDYTDPVYGIDEKLKELDDESKISIDGPIKPVADDAESFMKELKKLKESAEADNFAGFVVDNKDSELKDVTQKYTKKKVKDELPDIEIPDIPFTADNNESGAIDMDFLAQMEENLKQTQKERTKAKNASKKNTPKKYTKKKDN